MLSQGKQLETWEREEIQNPFIFISKIRKDIPSDFHKFLTGKLCYLPQTLEDMEQWLRGCEYATDMEQFGKNDYWQHPAEFEKRRKGDCDDHALWVWRVLFEMGNQDSEFVIGKVGRELHAWVHYRKNEEWLLIEATAKKTPMIHLVQDVKSRYIPFWSVDGGGKSYLYGGYVASLRKNLV